MDEFIPSGGGNSLMHASSGKRPQATDPRKTVITFLVLVFIFSGVFWYLTMQTPQVAENATAFWWYAIGAMWCPALAAIITRLVYQQNLKGFGIRPGKPIWLAAGMIIPIASGLFMFGTAWLTGIAPFDPDSAATIFSMAFIPTFLYALLFNCFAAAGEEFGWRGFLVPELARFMGFTKLALLSGAIWAGWHIPLMVFGTYHGGASIWYSLAVFVPSVMGAGLILAWLRIISGSVWVAVLYHGFWNYFIQRIFPAMTETTEPGEMMLGEFGWFVAIFYVALALVFWHLRDLLSKLPAEGV